MGRDFLRMDGEVLITAYEHQPMQLQRVMVSPPLSGLMAMFPLPVSGKQDTIDAKAVNHFHPTYKQEAITYR